MTNVTKTLVVYVCLATAAMAYHHDLPSAAEILRRHHERGGSKGPRVLIALLDQINALSSPSDPEEILRRRLAPTCDTHPNHDDPNCKECFEALVTDCVKTEFNDQDEPFGDLESLVTVVVEELLRTKALPKNGDLLLNNLGEGGPENELTMWEHYMELRTIWDGLTVQRFAEACREWIKIRLWTMDGDKKVYQKYKRPYMKSLNRSVARVDIRKTLTAENRERAERLHTLFADAGELSDDNVFQVVTGETIYAQLSGLHGDDAGKVLDAEIIHIGHETPRKYTLKFHPKAIALEYPQGYYEEVSEKKILGIVRPIELEANVLIKLCAKQIITTSARAVAREASSDYLMEDLLEKLKNIICSGCQETPSFNDCPRDCDSCSQKVKAEIYKITSFRGDTEKEEIIAHGVRSILWVLTKAPEDFKTEVMQFLPVPKEEA